METLAWRTSILLIAFSHFVFTVSHFSYTHTLSGFSLLLFVSLLFVTVFCVLRSLMLPLQQDYILLKAQIVINIFLPIKYFFN